MIYKIEFYYNGNKMKHKLYETEKSYEQYWKYHKDFMANIGLPDEGIVGLVDGKIDRSFGKVPAQKTSTPGPYFVKLTGFKSKEQAAKFLDWFEGQGEQDDTISIWLDDGTQYVTCDVKVGMIDHPDGVEYKVIVK